MADSESARAMLIRAFNGILKEDESLQGRDIAEIVNLIVDRIKEVSPRASAQSTAPYAHLKEDTDDSAFLDGLYQGLFTILKTKPRISHGIAPFMMEMFRYLPVLNMDNLEDRTVSGFTAIALAMSCTGQIFPPELEPDQQDAYQFQVLEKLFLASPEAFKRTYWKVVMLGKTTPWLQKGYGNLESIATHLNLVTS